MKTILFSFCLLFTAMSVNAFSTTNDNPKDDLTKQLSEIVRTSSIWDGTQEIQQLLVSFMINDQGQVVVLSTNESGYDSQIKSLLNYRNVAVHPSLTNKIFHLPIRIEPKA